MSADPVSASDGAAIPDQCSPLVPRIQQGEVPRPAVVVPPSQQSHLKTYIRVFSIIANSSGLSSAHFMSQASCIQPTTHCNWSPSFKGRVRRGLREVPPLLTTSHQSMRFRRHAARKRCCHSFPPCAQKPGALPEWRLTPWQRGQRRRAHLQQEKQGAQAASAGI